MPYSDVRNTSTEIQWPLDNFKHHQFPRLDPATAYHDPNHLLHTPGGTTSEHGISVHIRNQRGQLPAAKPPEPFHIQTIQTTAGKLAHATMPVIEEYRVATADQARQLTEHSPAAAPPPVCRHVTQLGTGDAHYGRLPRPPNAPNACTVLNHC